MRYKLNNTENIFLKNNSLIICKSCSQIFKNTLTECPRCKKKVGLDLDESDDRGMKFLNLTESLKKKTRFWREAMFIFASIKLPIEIIAYFELDSILGKLQGLGDLMFAFVFLIVSAWLIVAKNIKKRRGEFVE